MKKILAVTLVTLILFMTGCSAGNNLSEMSLVQGVGVDYQKNNTKISVQYLNLSKGTGTTENLKDNITSVDCAVSENISSAVAKATSSLASPVFFGQNKIIVFGADYAKEALSKELNYVLRAIDSRVDMLVAMSESTAEDIIKSSENKAKVPAQDIYDILKNAENNGVGACITVGDLLDLSCFETSDIYLPVLKCENDKTICSGVAVFSNGRYVATLSNFSSGGLMLINQRFKSGTVVIDDYLLGKVSVRISKVKVCNKAYIKDDKLNFSTKIKVSFNLNDVQNIPANQVGKSDIARIEKSVQKQLKNMCNQAVNTCFSSNSDPFSFGKITAEYCPKAYSQLRNDWRNQLKDVQYHCNVDAKLRLVNENSIRG